ncbi:MAG: DUF2325 domain-containing protein [Eubacteriales bacterium]|nr:DUF2325 domain-containing protein [Eubacteriales bacterium]MDY3332213.1 DUF2325 domain-containing protein [Gallibacter sp.]
MTVVIIGGNERMERRYEELCAQYDCRAKVLTKMTGSFQNKIGHPDLLVLFTSTVSHKMVRSALCETKGTDVKIARCHSSSMSALKGILSEHVGENKCRKN